MSVHSSHFCKVQSWHLRQRISPLTSESSRQEFIITIRNKHMMQTPPTLISSTQNEMGTFALVFGSPAKVSPLMKCEASEGRIGTNRLMIKHKGNRGGSAIVLVNVLVNVLASAPPQCDGALRHSAPLFWSRSLYLFHLLTYWEALDTRNEPSLKETESYAQGDSQSSDLNLKPTRNIRNRK